MPHSIASSVSQRYDILIGVGGIGSGMFFALDGNAPLGREESRGGVILDRRDYCKLHIISHTVSRICDTGLDVLPVGAVGADAAGDRLLSEMRTAGLNIRYVRRLDHAATLFSFCFIYPDGSGGNLTTTDSASSRIEPAALDALEPVFAQHAGRGIALAVPEAPLAVRSRLLDLGTQHDWLRVASFTSGEVETARNDGWLDRIDLLAINADEAAAFAECPADPEHPADTIQRAVAILSRAHPAMILSITAGRAGSWCWDGRELHHFPVLPVRPVGTAGAGDAHLAGVLCGLIAEATPAAAHELGALTASMAVTSAHTIHPGIDRPALAAFARRHGGGIRDARIRTLLDRSV